MPDPFFPNSAFGWTFVSVLLAIAAVAAFEDFRRVVIPKWLTYPLAGLGLLMNIIRGAWLGHLGHKVWLLGAGSTWLGAIDGALFSLLGFLVGFVLLFLMWIARTCGGGDVKLFGGVGAWVGPLHVLYVLAATLPILVVLFIVKAVFFGVSLQPGKSAGSKSAEASGDQQAGKKFGVEQSSPKMRLTYSFPVAIALVIVLLWTYRFDLQLVTAI